jgi:hypothetical protein
MYGRLDLHVNEVLACVFFRGQGQAVNQLAVSDFERRLDRQPPKPPEGGISFFRLDHVTLKTIIDTVKQKGRLNRGIAITTAGKLGDRGLRIFGDGPNHAHVCLHCPRCNGSRDDCIPDIPPCPLVPLDLAREGANDAFRVRLIGAMDVLIEASCSRNELLEIFGMGVDESDSYR